MKKLAHKPTLLEQLQGPSSDHALYAALQIPSLRAEALISQGLIAIQNQTPHLALLPIAGADNLLSPPKEIMALLLGYVVELLQEPHHAQTIYENALHRFPNNQELLKRCAKLYQRNYSGQVLTEKLAALELLEAPTSSLAPKMVASPYSPSALPAPSECIVDVLVPVYKGYQQTLDCIQSLLAFKEANQTPHDIIVLDDASLDLELIKALNQLADEGAINHIRRPENVGFIRNINLGMAMHLGRDVVWLNSDTRVHGNWLDRLRAAAYSEPDIASATPLSNNGELMSFPDIQQKSAMPTQEEQSNIDLIANLLNPAPVDIPLGCGFCFYIKRQALNEVGHLDEITLTRGYGEENDWCLRASAQGWRHVGAPNLFVAHQGGVSFGLEKALRAKQNNTLLMKRYPKAEGLCARFVRADPMCQIRKTILEQLPQSKRFTRPIGESAASGATTATPLTLEQLLQARETYWVIADRLDTPEQGKRWLTLARHLRRQGFTERLILMHATPCEVELVRTGLVFHLPEVTGIESETLLQLCQIKQALTLWPNSTHTPLFDSQAQLALHYLSDFSIQSLH